jgi:SOS-response transcriptional repressor LexA
MELSDLGRRVETRRVELGLTKDRLQQNMGTSPNTYYRMLSGDYGNISMQMFQRLADALGVPLAYLLSGDPVYQPAPPPVEPQGVHAKLDRILAKLGNEAAPQSPALELEPYHVGLWGQVAAGYGSSNVARTEPREWLVVPHQLRPHDGSLIGLEVRGDSMEPEINPGDYVIVWYPLKQPAVNLFDNGALVVVTVEGNGEEYEDYLKRYQLNAATGQDTLVSSNPAYDPIPIPSLPKYVGLVKMVVRN